MAEPTQKPFWRGCRRVFRWCRIASLLLVLFAVCLVIFLTKVGLPEVIKRPLLSELSNRGIEFQYKRIRWNWFQGIVAEQVTIGETNQTGGLRLQASEVIVRLDDEKLKDFRFHVRALELHQGNAQLALNETNQPLRLLQVTNVSTELHLLPHDQWELLHFKADTMGLHLALSGNVTNASKLGELMRKKKADGTEGPKKPKDAAAWRKQLRAVVDTIERMKFTVPPEIYLVVRGDGADASSFSAELNLQAKSAQTPWGSLHNLSLSTPLNVRELTNGLFQAEVKLRFDQGETPWGDVQQAKMNLQLTHGITNPAPFRADWDLSLSGLKLPYSGVAVQQLNLSGVTLRETNSPNQLETKFRLRSRAAQSEWAQASGAQLDAHLISSLTNPIPQIKSLDLTLEQPRSRWAQARKLQLAGNFALTNAPTKTETNWGFWTNLAPYAIQWKLNSEQLLIGKLRLPSLATSGRWTAPLLEVFSLESVLAGGEADVALQLDVATRKVWTKLQTDLDAQRLAYLMPTNAQQWLAEIKWERPPLLKLEGRMELPAWNQPATNWNDLLLTRAWLAGGISVGPISYQDFGLRSLDTDFALTNGVISVTRLHLVRPEGELRIAGHADLVHQTFLADLTNSVDLLSARTFFKAPKTRKVLDTIQFNSPPHIAGKIQATWTNWSTLQAAGLVNFTNFSYAGHGMSNLNAGITYTNQIIQINNIDLRRNVEENATADSVTIDLEKELLSVTNGLTHWDVADATQIIGPKTYEAVQPYQFANPPLVRVNGMIPLRDAERANLHFILLKGGPFHYWRFNLPEVAGTIHWVTNTLTITNVTGEFYQGRIKGDAYFDFAAKAEGTDYRFHVIATNSNLTLFLNDMLEKTNTLEGTIDCDLTITNANSKSLSTWIGYGTASMKEGFLWDIPLFSIMTPVLNSISEGMGKSKVKEGAASYYITNAVIYTTDLELKTPTINMKYRGSIDFDANVDAQVEAVLRNKPLSFITAPFTKLFEYKVDGSLGNPKLKPLYILPKLLFLPFKPFKALFDVFEGKPKEAEEPKLVPPEKSPDKPQQGNP
jgi:hypothetical protein